MAKAKTSTATTSKLAVAPRLWISAWFLITIPIIFWDIGYCFMRPHSFEGGKYFWIWKPYTLYGKVDLIYSREFYEKGDGFTNAQSFMNLLENIANILYLYYTYLSPHPFAPVIGFGSATATLTKTMLYWLQDYYCGWCTIGHNTWSDIVLLWIIPNGFWIVFPGLIVVQLAKDITAALALNSKAKTA